MGASRTTYEPIPTSTINVSVMTSPKGLDGARAGIPRATTLLFP